jgi:hypothetical protein
MQAKYFVTLRSRSRNDRTLRAKLAKAPREAATASRAIAKTLRNVAAPFSLFIGRSPVISFIVQSKHALA